MFVQICNTVARQREDVQYLHCEGASVVQTVVGIPFKAFLQQLAIKCKVVAR